MNLYLLYKIGKIRLIVNRLSIEEPNQIWPVGRWKGRVEGVYEARVAALVKSGMDGLKPFVKTI